MMDRNNRIWQDEDGQTLNPKIATWADQDGELYDVIRCDQWNMSQNPYVAVLEVWYYDCLEFMGYIICSPFDDVTKYMSEFMKLHHSVASEQYARKALPLPVILYKGK
jgi:hypothetical protein